MNAVEIEQAVSALADQPFDAAEFPFQFLAAFGNKDTTVKRLRAGTTNTSDLPSGVLQRNHIHLAPAPSGEVAETLAALRASPATGKAKARFVLATDGETLEAEDLTSGETVACAYADFPNHFGFFLPLAGITTVRQIRESAFDIRATGRLNKLYVELLKDNLDWSTSARRPDMNHFMARLIFCFFAEDTGIFHGSYPFTRTVEMMSDRGGENTHEIIAALFRAMNTPHDDRASAGTPGWAIPFPYVNGGLFSGSPEVPKFSRIARSYFLHIGNLDWTKINPDIFGSMIQAVADDEERGALGMHYTSVPNILKVLNPLFLDDLRAKLDEAGDNARKLGNLRTRMSRIRVFDPACGSGNFLVIAYKEMRAIEAEVNRRRDDGDRKSDIPLTNFRGIELRDFPAEIARLALVIAEFQCNVVHRGRQFAMDQFLPLNEENWIVCGNALRLDWLSICPPNGVGVDVQADDLFSVPTTQSQTNFDNQGGEIYICGNPPYSGSRKQELSQKSDLRKLAEHITNKWKSLDYVAGWLFKASAFADKWKCKFAFVCTSSIVEGLQVSLIWPHVIGGKRKIFFAHRSFKWANLANNNAGVAVVVVGVCASEVSGAIRLYDGDIQREVEKINPYLVPGTNVFIETQPTSVSALPRMTMGSMPRDGGNLILSQANVKNIAVTSEVVVRWIRRYVGSDYIVNGIARYCLWINGTDAEEAWQIEEISRRFNAVTAMRQSSIPSLKFADQLVLFVASCHSAPSWAECRHGQPSFKADRSDRG